MHGAINLKPLEQNIYDAIIESPVRWYALLVESGSERKACIWLKRRQFNPYWPRYKGTVKLNRHRREIRWRSVIPGYLFLPIPITQDINMDLLKKAPAIREALRNGHGDIVEIPEKGQQGIEKIRFIEEALNLSAVAAAQGIPFKVGQRIFIRRLEIEGTIARIDSRRQITVEAPMFGSRVRMVMPVAELEAM